MSLLAATWTGAGATVGLFIAATITAVYAVKAFRKQSAEVRELQQQATRDLEQRRRAQAAQVFVFVEERPYQDDASDMRAAACLLNASAQPVYDILLGLGESADKHRPVLMPGKELVRPGVGTAFANAERPVWATFRDSAGIHWRTTAGGQLGELPST